ncbi:MAG: beta-propeller fold lactonase family protein [Bacteroidota bacterium]
MKPLFLLVSVLFIFSCNQQPTEKKDTNPTLNTMTAQHIFVGTYTKKEGHVNGKAKGIYRLTLPQQPADDTTAKWTLADFESINPSFLTISPNKKYLYAVNELNPTDGDAGTVSAFRIDSITKDLHFLNQQSTHNYAPCHVTVDATNRLAFVSNYVGGVVCVYVSD